jgi:hypothetical protein
MFDMEDNDAFLESVERPRVNEDTLPRIDDLPKLGDCEGPTPPPAFISPPMLLKFELFFTILVTLSCQKCHQRFADH